MSQSKTKSVSELNMRLKKFQEEKSRLALLGQSTLQQYNYKEISNKIPITATGKYGQKYFANEILNQQKEEVDSEIGKLNKVLNNLKLKQKNNQLINQGFEYKGNKNDNNYIDQPIAELFDLPNPHYKKVFNPDAFYDINQSDDEDALQVQQRKDIEKRLQVQSVDFKKRKQRLQRVNMNFAVKQEEEIPQKKILKQDNDLNAVKKKKKLQFKDDVKDNVDKSFDVKSTKSTKSEGQQQGGKLPKWKQQSLAFRAALKAGKGNELSEQENNNIMSQMNSDLVKCEHCKRTFNSDAAQKHIPICKEKAMNEKMKTKRKRKIPLQL